ILTKYKVRVSWVQMKGLIGLSFVYALIPILLYSSYTYIDSGLATTLHFTYPAAVVLILALLFREHITKRQIVCIGICMIGIFLLYTPMGDMNLYGVLLAVSSGIAYAFYIILLRKSRMNTMPTLVASFWLALLSSIEIGITAFFTGNFVFDMKYQAWVSEFILALTATVIALVLFQKGIYLCGEIKASLLSAFEPITGVTLGIVLFHENIKYKEVLGISCILLAVLILVVQKNNDPK
ncbi:MAG: DMT family transporter, partial [Lachnospiraceae bacterium]|nr:DMT family transporter [Lachnospiraceae bacterium]